MAFRIQNLVPPKGTLMFAALGIVPPLGGVLMGMAEQNDLFGVFLGALSALTFLVPLALLVSVVGVVRWWMGWGLGWVLRPSLVLAWSLVLAVVVFEETGRLLDRWKVDAVREYVARAVPILDAMKARNGVYPQELPAELLGARPELFRDYGSYTSDGKAFRFEYINEPAEWAGGEGPVEFQSTYRLWVDEE